MNKCTGFQNIAPFLRLQSVYLMKSTQNIVSRLLSVLIQQPVVCHFASSEGWISVQNAALSSDFTGFRVVGVDLKVTVSEVDLLGSVTVNSPFGGITIPRGRGVGWTIKLPSILRTKRKSSRHCDWKTGSYMYHRD